MDGEAHLIPLQVLKFPLRVADVAAQQIAALIQHPVFQAAGVNLRIALPFLAGAVHGLLQILVKSGIVLGKALLSSRHVVSVRLLDRNVLVLLRFPQLALQPGQKYLRGRQKPSLLILYLLPPGLIAAVHHLEGQIARHTAGIALLALLLIAPFVLIGPLHQIGIEAHGRRRSQQYDHQYQDNSQAMPAFQFCIQLPTPPLHILVPLGSLRSFRGCCGCGPSRYPC